MAEPSDNTLNEWLRLVTTTLTANDLSEYQGVVSAIAAEVGPTSCFDLIEIACGQGSSEAHRWIFNVARSKKGDIPLTDNTALLARLASCVTSRPSPAIQRATAVVEATQISSKLLCTGASTT